MSPRSRRYFRVVASLTVIGGIAACVVDPLNPQPLPPSPENNAILYPDASFAATQDSGNFSTGADAADRADDDAAPPTVPADAGAGDASDSGDAGDPADAADGD